MPLNERIPILANIYQALLKGSFCFCENGGFTFAVDPEAKFVTIQGLLDLTKLDETEIIAEVEKFVQVSNCWHNKLVNQLDELTNKPAEADFSSESHPDLMSPGDDMHNFIRV